MRSRHQRWAARAGLCLALGLVTTVAVAWGLAAWLPHRGLEGRGEWLQPSKVALESFLAWGPGPINEFSRPGMVRRSWSVGQPKVGLAGGMPSGFLRPEDALLRSPPFKLVRVTAVPWGSLRRDWGALGRAERAGDDALPRWGIDDARGWPALALWCSIRARDPVALTLRASALPGGELGMAAAGCSGGVEISPKGAHVGNFRALPLRPIWHGLVINTAVYALAWAGLLAVPGRARRSRRRRRGRCVGCGYDLSGLTTGVACPECGIWAPATAQETPP